MKRALETLSRRAWVVYIVNFLRHKKEWKVGMIATTAEPIRVTTTPVQPTTRPAIHSCQLYRMPIVNIKLSVAYSHAEEEAKCTKEMEKTEQSSKRS